MRRAGLSIVLVAFAATSVIVAVLVYSPQARFGWMAERPVWLYLAALWLGGLKVWLGTMRPVAEIDETAILLRPLHMLGSKRVAWPSVRGTEQTIGGDRLIVYYDTSRGMRFAALNLNLVKGRRDFETLVDSRLREMGFLEKIVDRSRYLTRPEQDARATSSRA